MRGSLASAAPVFAALGDETRLKLVERLCQQGPASITRLSRDAPITRQAITKHLRVLQNAGLVRCSRRGRESYWELNQRHLALISAQWDDALGRLRRFVED
jgi:DNA-binding transcriptional ArsR family regulator